MSFRAAIYTALTLGMIIHQAHVFPYGGEKVYRDWNRPDSSRLKIGVFFRTSAGDNQFNYFFDNSW